MTKDLPLQIYTKVDIPLPEDLFGKGAYRKAEIGPRLISGQGLGFGCHIGILAAAYAPKWQDGSSYMWRDGAGKLRNAYDDRETGRDAPYDILRKRLDYVAEGVRMAESPGVPASQKQQYLKLYCEALVEMVKAHYHMVVISDGLQPSKLDSPDRTAVHHVMTPDVVAYLIENKIGTIICPPPVINKCHERMGTYPHFSSLWVWIPPSGQAHAARPPQYVYNDDAIGTYEDVGNMDCIPKRIKKRGEFLDRDYFGKKEQLGKFLVLSKKHPKAATKEGTK